LPNKIIDSLYIWNHFLHTFHKKNSEMEVQNSASYCSTLMLFIRKNSIRTITIFRQTWQSLTIKSWKMSLYWHMDDENIIIATKVPELHYNALNQYSHWYNSKYERSMSYLLCMWTYCYTILSSVFMLPNIRVLVYNYIPCIVESKKVVMNVEYNGKITFDKLQW